MSKSRTAFALKNSVATVTCEAVHLITGFIARTALTTIMGAEYLGINGLFTNILTILSFAELGIGSTLVYRMYKPLAEGDEDKLAAYTYLYKRIYRVIILVISVCGIIVIPFLRYIVEAPNVKEDLTLLYLLYLVDTVISYAYVYKKSILIADQKSYIVSLFTQAFNIIMNIVQCIVLLLTHNFIAYFAVKIICSLLNNIFCSTYAQKQYPYIANKNAARIDKQEISGLKTDVKGLLFNTISSTAFNGTDNIFISRFIGITYVGILSNYTMILGLVHGVMNKIFGSITASIGNLGVTGGMKQTEKVMNQLFFLNAVLYGYLTVGMILLMQEFVTKIWLTNEYYLSFSIVLASIIELYYRGIHHPLAAVRYSLGLFSQYQFPVALLAVLNIFLDYLLVKPLGILGLILATIFCRFGTYCIDIYVVYSIAFKESSLGYYLKMLGWSVFMSVECAICYYLIRLVPMGGVVGFALRIVIISIVYWLSFFIVFRNTDDYLYYKTMFTKIIKTKLKRSVNKGDV